MIFFSVTLEILLSLLISFNIKKSFLINKSLKHSSECASFAPPPFNRNERILQIFSSWLPGWPVHMGKFPAQLQIEITVTEPVSLLKWTHWKFYKGNRSKARFRQPSQPGRPGLYDEARKKRIHVGIYLLVKRFNREIFFYLSTECCKKCISGLGWEAVR